MSARLSAPRSRLRFLGTTVEDGHLYRGRWRVPSAPSDVDPCIGAVQKVTDLLKVGGTFQQIGAFTNPSGLTTLNPAWPKSRSGFLGGAGCTVFSQATWSGVTRDVDFAAMQGAGPGGVELVDFWDQTTGEVIVGSGTLCGANERFDATAHECVAAAPTPVQPGGQKAPGATPPIVPGSTTTPITNPSSDTSATPNLFWLAATGVALGVVIKLLA